MLSGEKKLPSSTEFQRKTGNLLNRTQNTQYVLPNFRGLKSRFPYQEQIAITSDLLTIMS